MFAKPGAYYQEVADEPKDRKSPSEKLTRHRPTIARCRSRRTQPTAQVPVTPIELDEGSRQLHSVERDQSLCQDEQWLAEWFAQTNEWQIEYDDLGTSYLSAGAVLAAAAMCDEVSVAGLAITTLLPMKFVELVLGCFLYRRCQTSDWFLELSTTMRCDRQGAPACLAWALEEFWLTPEISELADRLTELRGPHLTGGAIQGWLDTQGDWPERVLQEQVH